ncbi:MAG: hypothetical protein V1650_04160 [Candidatus Omnitrophota bacterium]
MAGTNYSYQKNMKELARKKKKEEKRLAKLAKKNAQAQTGVEPAPENAIIE